MAIMDDWAHEDWAMIIYNLFPLLAGTFSAWTPHIDRAASMGFDWLFVNPIQKPGASGSIYSVVDYFQLNPALVDPTDPSSPYDQVRAVVARAHERGLRIMIDLVINHCAADSELVSRHRQWFVREPDGTIAHPSCDEDGRTVVWRDLVQFDHAHTSDPEGLYQYCLGVVEHLLALGFDGFRCDAAYQVPRSTWRRLIEDTKRRRPEVVFAAETLGCSARQTVETAKAGFDYVFNSSKWWDFQSPWLLEQYELIREVAPSIGFPESHDTDRLAYEVGGIVEALKLRYLFAALFSSGCLMPIGYEFGFTRRLHVVGTSPDDWETTTIDLRPFITEVNATEAAHEVFQEDAPSLVLPSPNPEVVVLWRASAKTGQEALLILNRDLWRRQYVRFDNLGSLVQSRTPLVDVSPEQRLDYVPSPFEYELRPGQGLVFVTNGSDEAT